MIFSGRGDVYLYHSKKLWMIYNKAIRKDISLCELDQIRNPWLSVWNVPTAPLFDNKSSWYARRRRLATGKRHFGYPSVSGNSLPSSTSTIMTAWYSGNLVAPKLSIFVVFWLSLRVASTRLQAIEQDADDYERYSARYWSVMVWE